MRFGHFIKRFSQVHQKEHQIFKVLVLLLSLISIANLAYRYYVFNAVENEKPNTERFLALKEALLEENNKVDSLTPIVKTKSVVLDLNTATQVEMESVGIPKWQQRVILEFRRSGGVFPDTSKLSLKQQAVVAYAFQKQKKLLVDKHLASKPHTYRRNVIQLNSADTSSLKSLYGIGSKLSARIVKYRDKLGGFCSQNQLLEVYGLSDSIFFWNEGLLSIDTLNIKQININIADRKSLAAHPYISWQIATAIENYRKEHGVFIQASDLLNIVLIDRKLYKKLKPYISVN